MPVEPWSPPFLGRVPGMLAPTPHSPMDIEGRKIREERAEEERQPKEEPGSRLLRQRRGSRDVV